MSKQITGRVPLFMVGGNEHVYEDCYALVTITLMKTAPHILDTVFVDPAQYEAYFSTVGVTCAFWEQKVKDAWADDPEWITDDLLEGMDEAEYNALHAQGYVT